MYLPEIEQQIAFADLDVTLEATQLAPNVTKGISDVLKLCDAAGLDPHGKACRLSVCRF